MDKKVTSNFVYNLIYQFLAIALPIITVPYVSRVLGPQKIGEYNYINSIVSYFGIFAVLGTVAYGQREIAKAQLSKTARSKRFSAIFTFRIIMTIMVFVIYSCFITFSNSKYYLLFVANYFLILSWALDVSWYFQGVENFRVTAIRNGLVKVIATISIFIFVRSKKDILIYILIYTISTLLGNLTMFPFLKHEIYFVRVTMKDIVGVLKGSLIFFVPVLAIQIFNTINKIMLGASGETTQVGYFSQAVQIVNLCVGLLYALSSVLLPRVSFLFEEKKIKEMVKYMNFGIRNVYLMGIPMCLGCILVAKDFVPIFFGPGYSSVVLLLYILSPLFIIVSIGQLLGVYLLSINRQWQNTFAVIIAVIINIIGNYIAIRLRTGAVGVSVVTLLTELVSSIVQMVAIRDYISIKQYIVLTKYYIIPSCLMGIIVASVQYICNRELIALMLSVTLGVLGYLGYLLIVKDPFVRSLFSNILRKK